MKLVLFPRGIALVTPLIPPNDGRIYEDQAAG